MLPMRLLASEGSDATVRQGAAVTFKNLVKNNWVEKEADVVGARALPVAAGEKDQVRRCSSASYRRLALDPGALRGVVHHLRRGFPRAMAGSAARAHPAHGRPRRQGLQRRVGVLTTANTFKLHRQAYKSDELQGAKASWTPRALLLELLKEVSAAIDANAANPELLIDLFKCLRLTADLLLAEQPGAPRGFRGQMDAWMGEFHKFLCYDNSAGRGGQPGQGEGWRG